MMTGSSKPSDEPTAPKRMDNQTTSGSNMKTSGMEYPLASLLSTNIPQPAASMARHQARNSNRCFHNSANSAREILSSSGAASNTPTKSPAHQDSQAVPASCMDSFPNITRLPTPPLALASIPTAAASPRNKMSRARSTVLWNFNCRSSQTASSGPSVLPSAILLSSNGEASMEKLVTAAPRNIPGQQP